MEGYRLVWRTHRNTVLAALWLIAVLTVFTIAFFVSKNSNGPTAVIVGDANYYYAYLPSLVFDRDINFTNEYVSTGNWYRLGMAPTGTPSNVFGVGPAIFSLPFFLIGLLLSKLGGVPPTGFGPIEMKATLYASVVFSVFSVWPAAKILQRHFGWGWLAWSVPVVVLAGTSATYYAIRQPGYAHPITMFWVTALLNHFDGGSVVSTKVRSLRWWTIAGGLLGAAMLSRPQACTWAFVLLYPAWLDLRGGASFKQIAPRWASACLTCAVCFFPQLWAWKVMYGSWLYVPQGAEFMRWDQPALGPVLFSSRNGLLSFTPLITLALLGFVTLGRKQWRVGMFLLLVFFLQVVVNGAVWDWWAGGSYGGRRFESCYAVYCFGLAALVGSPWRFQRQLRRHLHLGVPVQRLLAGGATVAATVYVLVLMAGNIALTSKISPPNLQSEGGQPYYKRLLETIPKPWAAPVAGLSYWSTKPARWWFARKYGADPSAYDWAVGKFFLGETYPGLNSRLPARSQHVNLHISQPFLVGHDPTKMPITTHDGRLRMLLPINRKHGPLEVRLDFDRPPPQKVAVLWNRRTMSLTTEGHSVRFTAARFRRGVNVLDLQVGSEVSVLSFFLSVPENGLP